MSLPSIPNKFAAMSIAADDVDAKLVTFNLLIKKYKTIRLEDVQAAIPTKEIKEKYGIDLNPRVMEGKLGAGLLCIESMGDLFDHDPKEYYQILAKLKSLVLGNASGAPAMESTLFGAPPSGANTAGLPQIPPMPAASGGVDVLAGLFQQMTPTNNAPPITTPAAPAVTLPATSPSPSPSSVSSADVTAWIKSQIANGNAIIPLDEFKTKYAGITEAIIAEAATKAGYNYDASVQCVY